MLGAGGLARAEPRRDDVAIQGNGGEHQVFGGERVDGLVLMARRASLLVVIVHCMAIIGSPWC